MNALLIKIVIISCYVFKYLSLLCAIVAMIAGLAYRYLMDGYRDDLTVSASARVTAFKKF